MGVPLTGVDIQLGKNPGGNVVARSTTDSEGNFALPVVPKGSLYDHLRHTERDRNRDECASLDPRLPKHDV
jgi:hypothetical protein